MQGYAEIARASSYVWVCAVQFVEVRPCERFGDVWKIEGSTCLLNEGRMCCIGPELYLDPKPKVFGSLIWILFGCEM
jgi:hypothetical protein